MQCDSVSVDPIAPQLRRVTHVSDTTRACKRMQVQAHASAEASLREASAYRRHYGRWEFRGTTRYSREPYDASEAAARMRAANAPRTTSAVSAGVRCELCMTGAPASVVSGTGIGPKKGVNGSLVYL